MALFVWSPIYTSFHLYRRCQRHCDVKKFVPSTSLLFRPKCKAINIKNTFPKNSDALFITYFCSSHIDLALNSNATILHAIDKCVLPFTYTIFCLNKIALWAIFDRLHHFYLHWYFMLLFLWIRPWTCNVDHW